MRRDAHKVLNGLHAAEPAGTSALPIEYPGPVSVVWGRNDHVSADGEGEKLAGRFTNARLSLIRNSGLLVPIDQPEMLAKAIVNLLSCDIQSKKERAL